MNFYYSVENVVYDQHDNVMCVVSPVLFRKWVAKKMASVDSRRDERVRVRRTGLIARRGCSLKWVKAGAYAIQSGEWSICKARVNGQWRYSLYEGKKLRGVYATAETAKEAIAEKVAA